MPKAMFQLNGLEEFKKLAAQLPRALEEKVYNQAMGAAARVVRDEMRLNAPVDKGRLRDSIVAFKKKVGKNKYAYGVGPYKKMPPLPGYKTGAGKKKKRKNNYKLAKEITLSQAYKAYFMEFGTKNMAARPFLRRSVDLAFPVAAQKMVDILSRGLAREAVNVSQKVGFSGKKRRRR